MTVHNSSLFMATLSSDIVDIDGDISPNSDDIARDPDNRFTVVVHDDSEANYIDKDEYEDAARDIEDIIEDEQSDTSEFCGKYDLRRLQRGNEAIAFQISSPLAKALVDLFQKGIDYYAEYPPYTGIGNSSTWADEKMHDVI